MIKFIFILLITGISFTQSISDYAYMGAQSLALAGAVVAEVGNSSSIFHNPAGIAESEQMQFTAGGGNLYGFSWLPTYHLNGSFNSKYTGKMALALQQIETTFEAVSLSNEMTLSIAKGLDLQHDKNSRLSIGATANYVRWSLGKSAGVSGDGSDGLTLGTSETVSLDFGVLGSLRGKYRFGAMVKNLNSTKIGDHFTSQTLPRRINVGVTYFPISALSTSIVAEQLLGDDNLQIKGGVHYRFNKDFHIYIGAQSNPNRMGMGFSYEYNLNNQAIQFSYGLLTHPVLPVTSQMNMTITL